MEAIQEEDPAIGAASNANREAGNEVEEPPAKKLCTKSSLDAGEGQSEEAENSKYTAKLEKRLSTVLCCNVCLDLPLNAIYQCPHGHLMCAGCFNHLLADARLKNETPTCPNCRIEIGESSCSRNLAVEKAVSELPISCTFCKCEVPRCHAEKHKKDQCQERPVSCKYHKIGCHWQGIFSKKSDHEERCAQARKTGLEIMASLDQVSKEEERKLVLYKSIVSLLSSQRTIVHDVQLRPKRTEDFIPELYYETSRFCAFGQDWMIRVQVVGNAKSIRQGFTFQLVQLTKSASVFLKFIFVRSPYGDVDIHPVIFQHDFTMDSTESLEHDFPMSQDNDVNKMLAARLIPLRIIMFQTKSPMF